MTYTQTPNGEFVEKLRHILFTWDFDDKRTAEDGVQEVLKLIREEVVPEEKKDHRGLYQESNWNLCREAMLRKLGGEV